MQFIFIFGYLVFPIVECQLPLYNYIQFEVEFNKIDSPTIIYCNKTIEVNVTTAGVYFLNTKTENSRVTVPCYCYLHDPTWNQQRLSNLEISLREHKIGTWIELKRFSSTAWGYETHRFPTFQFVIGRKTPQFVLYTAGNENFTGSQYLGFTLAGIVDTSVLMTCKPENFDPMIGPTFSTSTTSVPDITPNTKTTNIPFMTTAKSTDPMVGPTSTTSVPKTTRMPLMTTAKITSNNSETTVMYEHTITVMMMETTTANINETIVTTTPILTPSTTTVAPTDNIIIIASVLAVIVVILIVGVLILVAFVIKYKRKEKLKGKFNKNDVYDDTALEDIKYGPYNMPEDEIYDEIADDIPDIYMTQSTNDETGQPASELPDSIKRDTYLEPVSNGGYLEPVNIDINKRRDTYLEPLSSNVLEHVETNLTPVDSRSHLKQQNVDSDTYLEPRNDNMQHQYVNPKGTDESSILQKDGYLSLENLRNQSNSTYLELNKNTKS